MNNGSNLFDLIFGPLGLVIIIGLFASVRMLFKNSFFILYLMAALALFASFSVFVDPFGRATPVLVFPLESLRHNGRTISIGLLLLISFYVFYKNTGQHTAKFKDFYFIQRSLLVIQSLIFFKNLIYGSFITASLTISVFLLVYSIYYKGFSYWLYNEKYFKRSVFAFLMAVVVFILMAFYQSLFDPMAMSFIQGRFMGMTGNAQHAAVLLTSGVPLFLVSIIEVNKRWKKALLIIGLFSTFYYLTLTGSRTGMIMSVVSMLIFLLGYKGKGVKWLITGAIAALIFVSITDFNPFGGVDETLLDRYGSTENTRAEVIDIQLRQFSQNIVFGAEPRGDRVGFAENSYLAVAASLGLIGLLPLIFMILGIFKMLLALWKRAKYVTNKHYYFLVVAGLVSLLVGGLAEAYLLGNLTWPIILLLCYVHWGYYLLKGRTTETAEV